MELPKNCNSCGFFIDDGYDKCQHDHASVLLKITDINELPEFCPIKEDELDAKRFRVHYRGESFYLCVAEREGTPWEVFVEHAISGKHELRYMMSAWDTSTRFISRDLKREPLESTIRQLDKSSRNRNDLPDILATQLRKWL